MSARMEKVREALDWLDSRSGNLFLQERKSLLVAALLEVEEWEARLDAILTEAAAEVCECGDESVCLAHRVYALAAILKKKG